MVVKITPECPFNCTCEKHIDYKKANERLKLKPTGKEEVKRDVPIKKDNPRPIKKPKLSLRYQYLLKCKTQDEAEVLTLAIEKLQEEGFGTPLKAVLIKKLDEFNRGM